MAPVTDARDIRTLIPRVRRAIDGPAASSDVAPSTTLSDVELTALIADTLAKIVLREPDNFLYTLEVTSRDADYLAPDGWLTEPAMGESEQVVVAAQAALDYFFVKLSDLKVQETISDEGRTWSYSLSANLLTEQLRSLRAERDAALAAVASSGVALDRFESFLAIRDADTSALIEPWVEAGRSLPIGYDPRFG